MSSFKQLVDAEMKHGITEVSPSGWKGTVKAMKDEPEIDNPYALANWMKKKGYKSHKKASGAKKESTESILIWHPIYGKGIVEEIAESTIEITWDNLQNRITSPSVIPFSEAKYLSRVKEQYSSDPEDVDYDTEFSDEENKEDHPFKKDKKKKRVKKDINEGLIAMGMANIGGTDRVREENDLDLDNITLADLLAEDEPNDQDGPDWEHGKRSHNSSDKSELRNDSKDGADYTNVPRPADSIVTNQEDQPKYEPKPLSTHAGYEEAHNEPGPDGDYGVDLVPVDAPKTPQVRDLENQEKRHNTRKSSGSEEDTQETDGDNIDLEGSKPEEDEDKQMKKYESENFYLTAKDLGLLEQTADYIDSPEEKATFRKEMKKSGDFSKASTKGKKANETQHGEGMSGYAEHYGDDYDMSETHDPSSGEIAFTREFLDKLLSAVSQQSPDDKMLGALCDGLESVSTETGKTLDVSDWDAVKAEATNVYSGSDDYDDTPMNAPDSEMEPGADQHEDDAYFEDPNVAGDSRHTRQGVDSHDPEGMEDDYHGSSAHDYKGNAYHHENHGDDYDYDDYDDYDYDEDRAKGDGEKAGPEGGEEHEGKTKMMDRKDQRRKYSEAEGSGTPVGYGSTSGPGGGSTKDLSKSKKWNGKAVGTETGKGPGGGSSDDFGQKPADKGGSNLLPANDRGSKLGAAENPFSKGEPNPRNQKPLASESRRKKAKQKLDEAILLGMSSIPYIGREADDIPPEAFEDDDEIKMIKRRAGMANWWK